MAACDGGKVSTRAGHEGKGRVSRFDELRDYALWAVGLKAARLPAVRASWLTARFVKEYLLWTVAPLPFVVPWLAWLGARGALVDALFPGSWDAAFGARLDANCRLWLSSYGAAFLWYHGARLVPRWRALKYDARCPDPRFVAEEAARSLGGIVVLTVMQLGYARVRGPAGPAAVPPVSHLAAGALTIMLWADLHFYATHRLLHTPRLFRAIHRTHHRSHNVDPFSGLSMHPLEHLLYFSAFLLPGLPFWTANLVSVVMVVWPIPAHLGYGPFDKHHWDHHTRFNYCYGSSMLWDELLGTAAPDRGAKATSAAAARRAAEARAQRALVLADAE